MHVPRGDRLGYVSVKIHQINVSNPVGSYRLHNFKRHEKNHLPTS